MASRFARATARANRVFMDRLTDGTATYTRFRRFQVQVDESTPVRN